MQKFLVALARTINPDHVVVFVEAKDKHEADRKAREIGWKLPNKHWLSGETVLDVYVTDVQEIE